MSSRKLKLGTLFIQKLKFCPLAFNTINKAGPTGPSFVAPGLLFSHEVRYHKKGLREIAIGSEQGSMAGPWMYTES